MFRTDSNNAGRVGPDTPTRQQRVVVEEGTRHFSNRASMINLHATRNRDPHRPRHATHGVDIVAIVLLLRREDETRRPVTLSR
jgi:hypothetical protein